MALVVENSYLDLASVDYVTREELVKIRNDSQLYFSLSESHQGGKTSPLHGMSLGDEFNLR